MRDAQPGHFCNVYPTLLTPALPHSRIPECLIPALLTPAFPHSALPL